MAKTRRVNARLDESRAAKLSILCEERGASVTDVIQEAIDMAYAKHRETGRSAKAIFDRFGFIGSGEGPQDLSENTAEALTEYLEKKHGDR